MNTNKDKFDYFLEAYKEASETYVHLNTKGNVLLSLEIALLGGLILNIKNILFIFSCGPVWTAILLGVAVFLIFVAIVLTLISFGIHNYDVILPEAHKVFKEEGLFLGDKFFELRSEAIAIATDSNHDVNNRRSRFFSAGFYVFVVAVFMSVGSFASPIAKVAGDTRALHECFPPPEQK